MRSTTSSDPRWGIKEWLGLMLCAVFVIASGGCATKMPAPATPTLTAEPKPEPCSRPALETDDELAAMATWGVSDWARAYFARQAEAEGKIAACETDRDRLWLRQDAARVG